MILFLKSYVRAHNRTLSDGTVVPVSAHHTKTTAGIAAKDDRTPDMFKPPITAANRPTQLPLDAAKHPEKYTPDMFTGETAAQIQSRTPKVGDRVQLDVQLIRHDRNMFTLDRSGQPSPSAVRTTRILEEILSRTKNRPFVTRASVHHDNIEDEYVEIATGPLDSDERVMTLTVPKKAVQSVLAVDKPKASPIMVMRRTNPAPHRGAEIHDVIQPTSGSELKQEQQAMSHTIARTPSGKEIR